MQLDDWLKEEGRTQKWLAAKLKITEKRLSLILSGHRDIKLPEVMDIVKITKNKVKPQDWIDRVKAQ